MPGLPQREPRSKSEARIDASAAIPGPRPSRPDARRPEPSKVGCSLRLALLAPDMVEAILGSWAGQRVMLELLEKLERPLPAGWEEQHRMLGG